MAGPLVWLSDPSFESPFEDDPVDIELWLFETLATGTRSCFSLPDFVLDAIDLGIAAGGVVAAFGFDIVGMLFSVVVAGGVFVPASACWVRDTASEFFMVSIPFPVVPLGPVI